MQQHRRIMVARAVGTIVIGALGLIETAMTAEPTPLSLEHFAGSESWPVYAPGKIAVDNAALGNLRVAYDGDFDLPDGRLELATYIDLIDAMFNGEPADWMQWTFTSETPGEGAVANLDLLIMDRTGALRYRMLPSAPGSTWGGPYNFIAAGPTAVTRTILSDTADPTTEHIRVDGPIFDFGGLPFVFPFMALEAGQGLRLRAYQQSGANGVQLLDVKVIGWTKITDTAGRRHDALEIQTLAPSRSTLVSFYVSDTPPYFYGWDYRRVADGSSLFKMTYRGFVSTHIARGGTTQTSD